MRDEATSRDNQEYSLQLTIQSGELVRSGIKRSAQISLSCDISAMPGVNCTLILKAFMQDLGPVGYINFEKTRPTAYAEVKVPVEVFSEMKDLLKVPPPRPPSLFLVTSRFKDNFYGDLSIEDTGPSLTIYDIKWRYPIL